jgi:cytochrome c-type biogenesis protein CcmH
MSAGRYLLGLALSALALIALLLVSAGPALAQSDTSLADLEDEVMCTVCGTLLGLSDSPQAERERALIRRLIDQGLSKEEIKERLVDEYGPGVLALPDSSGFNLTAYLAPIAGLLIAAAALFFAIRRWRRDTEAEAADAPAGGDDLSASESEELDSDLSRYDL